MVLAQGFYGGSASIRSHILALASSKDFPRDSVANVMVEMQPIVQIESKCDNHQQQQMENFYIPSMSIAQSEKLEEVLNKLRVIMFIIIKKKVLKFF